MDFLNISPGEHFHHSEPPTCGLLGEGDRVKFATIVFQRWTDLHLNYILGASGTITPPTSWYIALAQEAVSTFNRNDADTTPTELGTTTANGYSRQSIARSIATGSIDWQASTFDNTLSTGGTSMQGDQVTFSFTGAPSPNDANSWYMTGASSGTGDYLYVAADTAAQRTFANGDTEKVTPTLKSG